MQLEPVRAGQGILAQIGAAQQVVAVTPVEDRARGRRVQRVAPRAPRRDDPQGRADGVVPRPAEGRDPDAGAGDAVVARPADRAARGPGEQAVVAVAAVDQRPVADREHVVAVPAEDLGAMLDPHHVVGDPALELEPVGGADAQHHDLGGRIVRPDDQILPADQQHPLRQPARVDPVARGSVGDRRLDPAPGERQDIRPRPAPDLGQPGGQGVAGQRLPPGQRGHPAGLVHHQLQRRGAAAVQRQAVVAAERMDHPRGGRTHRQRVIAARQRDHPKHHSCPPSRLQPPRFAGFWRGGGRTVKTYSTYATRRPRGG